MRNGLGWTTLVIFVSERHFGVTFRVIFQNLVVHGGPHGSPLGPLWHIVWCFFFETDFLSIFDSISGRAGGMGGRLPSLRICRTWDDLNHAATPAGVRRINWGLAPAAGPLCDCWYADCWYGWFVEQVNYWYGCWVEQGNCWYGTLPKFWGLILVPWGPALCTLPHQLVVEGLTGTPKWRPWAPGLDLYWFPKDLGSLLGVMFFLFVCFFQVWGDNLWVSVLRCVFVIVFGWENDTRICGWMYWKHCKYVGVC